MTSADQQQPGGSNGRPDFYSKGYEFALNRPPDMDELRQTAVCSNCTRANTSAQPLRACMGCRQTFYCNKSCQHTHWPIHKPDCFELASQALYAASRLWR